MVLGECGKKLIKSYETLRLEAYMPTPNDKPTIGWGHTKGVKMGDVCNVAQAEKWFLEDTAEAAGDYYGACAFFFEYRKQTNQKTKKKEDMRGLALRRTREMGLFLEDRF